MDTAEMDVTTEQVSRAIVDGINGHNPDQPELPTDQAEQPETTTAPKPRGRPRNPRELLISEIRTNGGTQMRETINRAKVSEYAELMADGEEFDPVDVFQDKDGVFWLADGFHRIEARKLNNDLNILARVRPGERREAILHAIQANSRHGLQRTAGDKRKAVLALLTDPEWQIWVNREIARQAGVSHTFVNKLRDELAATSGNDCQTGQEKRTFTRGGKQHTQTTGKRKPAAKASNATAAPTSGSSGTNGKAPGDAGEQRAEEGEATIIIPADARQVPSALKVNFKTDGAREIAVAILAGGDNGRAKVDRVIGALLTYGFKKEELRTALKCE
jgi:hypothetical protein